MHWTTSSTLNLSSSRTSAEEPTASHKPSAFCAMFPVCSPTCSSSAPPRRDLVADVEETAEQQLFGVLNVEAVS